MAKKNSRPNLAARKSASKKAEEQKIAQQKAFWEAHKKQILSIAAIAVAVIAVLCLAIDYLYVPAYSVRDFMGGLLDVKENAIIRGIDGRYYELGAMNQPEGYEPADFGADMTSDPHETYFYYETTEEGKAVNDAFVIGVVERTAAEMLESISLTFNYEEQTENKQAVIGGHDVHYFYSKGLVSEEKPDVYTANITSYVDTVKDSCVLMSLSSVEGALDELPTEEAMLAEAEAIFACLEISK